MSRYIARAGSQRCANSCAQSLGAKGEFPLVVEMGTDAWTKQGSSYAIQPFGSSGTLLWSFADGRLGAGIERVDFAPNGAIARYRYAIQEDAFTTARTVFTVDSPQLFAGSCQTPFRCMYLKRFCSGPSATTCYTGGYENQAFSTREAAGASPVLESCVPGMPGMYARVSVFAEWVGKTIGRSPG